jgi:hypothetical protein
VILLRVEKTVFNGINNEELRMNYTFYVELGNMTYETWYDIYTAPDALEKRSGWWGPEHVAKSGENSAMIFAQISDEDKLTEHMAFVRKMSAEKGMKHDFYRLVPDSR